MMGEGEPRVEVRPNSLAILGWEEGGAGLIDSWIESAGDYHVACFVHPCEQPPDVDAAAVKRMRSARQFDVPSRTSFKGRPLLVGAAWCDRLHALGIRRALVILSDHRERLAQIERARAAGLELVSAIHPTAVVLPDVILADNIVLHARAVVGYRAELETGVILNTGAQIDHHGVVRACAAVDPGAVCAGNVTVERFAQIHTGAVIINKIRIGEGAVVGAGAVVIRDVPAGATVVGNPARALRRV